MDIKISIIVPVYKVEEYLPRCLKSLEDQTMRDGLEIFLVDDGSPDRCGEMCDEFAQSHANVRVIHKENGGLSSARNAALDLATGQYLLFLDSDDFLRADACQFLYDTAIETGADVVSFIAQYVWDDNEVTIPRAHEPRMIRGTHEIFGAMADIKWGVLETGCDKLYRRELFDGLRFPIGRHHEDAFLMPSILSRTESFYVLPDALYFYRQRPGSITHSRGDRTPDDRVFAHEEIVRIALEKFPEHAETARARLYMIRLYALNTILECPHFRKHICWKAQIRALRKVLPDLLKMKNPRWLPRQRKIYAVLLACFPHLAFLYVRIRFRERRKHTIYAKTNS